MKIIKYMAKYFGIREIDIIVREYEQSIKEELSACELKVKEQLESLLTNRVGRDVTVDPTNLRNTFNVKVSEIYVATLTVIP